MNKPIALITGASQGIGRELARVFAAHQHDLVLVARDHQALQSLASELPGTACTIVAMDLSLPGAAEKLFGDIKQKGLTIEVLVNNAGFGDFGFFHETKLEKELNMIDLNVKALVTLTKLFGKEMVKRRAGKIMNLASTAAFQPGPLMAVYFATKHFVLAFSEAVANEWAPFQVGVTALCPGATESQFQAGAAMQASGLVKNKKLPSARAVAVFGYRALMEGRRVAIHGFRNRVMAWSVRLFPRNWVTAIVRRLSEAL
jgi:hypothetical protein